MPHTYLDPAKRHTRDGFDRFVARIEYRAGDRVHVTDALGNWTGTVRFASRGLYVVQDDDTGSRIPIPASNLRPLRIEEPYAIPA